METTEKKCGSRRAGRRGIMLCLLMISLCSAHAESLFSYAEHKTAATLTIPSENTGKEKALTAYTGLKLRFRDADLRGYVTLPKTELETIRETETLSEKLDLLNDVRYGAGIFLFKKTLPTTLKVGHNTYSKSVSKLRNPAPSMTANPLAKSFAFSTGTGASLPTLTSSVQPLSYSLALAKSKRGSPLQIRAEAFASEEKELFATSSASYALSKSAFVQGAFSLARFCMENNTAVLKKNKANFSADYFYAGLMELCFHSPLAKIHFYSGLHESPYDTNPLWFRLDARSAWGALLFNASYFSIPTASDSPEAAPLIGGSSSVCRTTRQVSANPQILFLFDDKNASSVRLGFSALENWRVTATNTPVHISTAKFRAGLLYESRFFAARFDWTHANILLTGEPPTKSSTPEEYQSVALSSSYIGKIAKYSLSGSYAHYPPVTSTSALKEIYSADAKIAVPALNLTTQAGIDLTYKDGERYSAEFDASVTYTIRRKFFRSSVKVGLALPF